jgi:tetratricopeptide (TPR) repeat protein
MTRQLLLDRRDLYRRFLLVVFALSLFCEFLDAQAAISTVEEKQFEAAMSAMDRGDAVQAETLLKPLQIKHSDLFALNESLGLLYARQNRLQEALPLLKAAANEQPSSDVAHANLGSAYFKLGKNADALRELEQAARINPANVSTQQTLGEVWTQQHQPDRAAHAFASALRLSPDNPDLAYDEALALHEAGQSEEAKDVLAHMQGVDQSAAAQSLYGDIEEKLGNYKEAVQRYGSAANLDPSEINVFTLGTEFLRHWTFEPAIQEFNFGISHFPASVKMRLALGIAYYGNRNYDKSLPIFTHLLEDDPDNVLYAELVGRTCMVETEGADTRCDSLVQFTKRHPENALITTFAAAHIIQDLKASSQVELAHSLLTAALKTDPKLSLAQYQLGMLMQTEEHWADSIPYLEAAIHLQPEYSEAHYRLGLAYVRVGRKNDAHTEMLLFRKYHQQAEEEQNAKLRQITTFVVSMR